MLSMQSRSVSIACLSGMWATPILVGAPTSLAICSSCAVSSRICPASKTRIRSEWRTCIRSVSFSQTRIISIAARNSGSSVSRIRKDSATDCQSSAAHKAFSRMASYGRTRACRKVLISALCFTSSKSSFDTALEITSVKISIFRSRSTVNRNLRTDRSAALRVSSSSPRSPTTSRSAPTEARTASRSTRLSSCTRDRRRT
mmetsp:Transcript_46621/g.77674  ORF Transcript_46621/g.77674 Transcript_46621/m.77674 type:complete len:201 (-) Transcript_46621:1917-2519(-)